MYQKKSESPFFERLKDTLAQCDVHSGTGSEGGMFRVGPLVLAQELLRQHGADPAKTAKAAGLDPVFSQIRIIRFLSSCWDDIWRNAWQTPDARILAICWETELRSKRSDSWAGS
jgi:hypothetical protein